MNDKNEDVPKIDKELKQTLENVPMEDPFITDYGKSDGENVESDAMGMTQNWFPEPDEWEGKTAITPEQARPLAMLKHYPKIFDELEEIEPLFDSVIEDYLQLLTSIGGESRKEQASILRSFFGGPGDEQLAERGAMLKLFNGNIGDEDE